MDSLLFFYHFWVILKFIILIYKIFYLSFFFLKSSFKTKIPISRSLTCRILFFIFYFFRFCRFVSFVLYLMDHLFMLLDKLINKITLILEWIFFFSLVLISKASWYFFDRKHIEEPKQSQAVCDTSIPNPTITQSSVWPYLRGQST